MNNRLLFIALYMLGVLMLVAGCNKSIPERNPGVPYSGPGSGGSGGGNGGGSAPPVVYPRTLRAMVLEYGTDRPLSDVESIILSGNQPDTQITDSNGVCFFMQRVTCIKSFRKAGYWNARFYEDLYGYSMLSPLQSFPYPPGSLYTVSNGLSCDSFVIRLFPIKNVQVHVKDSLHLSTCTDCNVILAVNGLFPNNGTNYTVYNGGSYTANGIPVILRAGIDTTFSLPVFGNALNIFSVGEDDVSNGWPGFWNFIRKDTVMISQNVSSVRVVF